MQFGAVEAVLFWGKYRPNTVAIVANGEERTYAQLAHDVRALASRAARMLNHVKCVGVTAGRKMDYLAQILALHAAGKTPVALHANAGIDHLNQCIMESGAQVVLVDQGSNLTALGKQGKLKVPALSLATDDSTDVKGFTAANSEPTDPWAILFSSGSTGLSKAILRDQYSMVTEFIGWCLELGLTRHTRFYVARPIYYTGGIVLTVATLLVGGTVVLDDYMDDGDVNEVAKGIERATSSRKLPWLFLVPDQIRAVNSQAMKLPCGRIENVLVMGAPISGNEKQSFGRHLNCNVIESWGNTESLGTITDPEDLQNCPDSVGRPFVTDELYIVDEQGKTLPCGKVGRLAGGKEAGFAEYVGREEETKKTITNGLIISEDCAYEDEQGHLFVQGRVQEQVRIGDGTYFLNKIEANARACQFAREICICPAEGDEGQVKLHCLIVPTGDKEVRMQALSVFQAELPMGVQLGTLKEVAQLPKTPAGKLDRAACASLLRDV